MLNGDFIYFLFLHAFAPPPLQSGMGGSLKDTRAEETTKYFGPCHHSECTMHA